MASVKERHYSNDLERVVGDALEAAGIGFTTPDERRDPTGLDFRLHNGIEIEVKTFHSDRIARQMASVQNVIALQGEPSVRFFVSLLSSLSKEGN